MQLLLNSLVPKGIKGGGSNRLKLELSGAWSACAQVAGWRVELLIFLWLVGDAILLREFMMDRWAPIGFGGTVTFYLDLKFPYPNHVFVFVSFCLFLFLCLSPLYTHIWLLERGHSQPVTFCWWYLKNSRVVKCFWELLGCCLWWGCQHSLSLLLCADSEKAQLGKAKRAANCVKLHSWQWLDLLF